MFHSPSHVPGDGVCSAQTLAAAALEAIGKIRTASGSVTLVRADGEIVRVSVGDLVYRGDAIETGTDGSVGITFADGTVFNLSNSARMVLDEFVRDPSGSSNSTLFSLLQGTFAFIAGKAAKTGSLQIDTPVGRIRGTARDGGVGVLTLGALTFSLIEEIQAASVHDTFLDDGTITYKDAPHGTFEIVTRDGRVVVADDPGETVVVDPAGTVTRMPNSSSRMADLQSAQQAALGTLSLGQQGAASGGSSTQTFDTPLQLQPINLIQPQNNGPTLILASITPTINQQFIETPVPKISSIVTPVFTGDSTGLHPATEVIGTTGSGELDTASPGTLTFSDFKFSTVSASLESITWSGESGGTTLPSSVPAVLAGALSITTNNTDPVSGSIAATFSAADKNFDFLAAGETLTIVYNVTITDDNGNSLTRPVTIIVTGTNDAPALAADPSGPHNVTEGLNTTGTLTFTDVDLTDHHTVSTSVASATWSGGATLPSGPAAALAGALSTTTTDSTGSGSGSIAVTFSAADSAFDFLAAGQTLKITYNVTVTDNNRVSSSQPVTFTVIGTNDAPVLTSFNPTLTTITEDQTTNGGQTVSSFVGSSISDVDSGAVQGIAITGLTATNGTWQYSSNGGTTWTAIGAVSTGSALLLSSSDLIRFVPDGNNSGTDTITYLAWDQTSGTAGTKVDASATGGTTAFSTASDSAHLTVTSVNDAPVLTSFNPTLTTITEDQTTNGGQTVSSFVGSSISDVDSGAVQGIAITGLTATNGTWQYSSNGGTTWTAIGAVSTGSALLLSSSDLIRFVPDGNNGGTDTITYLAWDQTSGTAGTKVDASATGGTTVFSTASDRATITVTSVNDAPVATITPTTYSATEQVSLNLKNSMSVSDVDSLGGVETVTLSVTEGTLTVTAGTSGAVVSGSGTSTVTITGTLAQINALLNTDGTSTVSYIDNTDTPSASAALTLSVNDNGNFGIGGALTGSDAATVNITAVNDAPVATITPTTYNAAGSLNLKNTGLSVSDVDGGIETVTLSVGEGTLTVTAGTSGATVLNSGTPSVTIIGTIAQINALLNTDGTSTVSYLDNSTTPSGSTTLTLSIKDNGALTSSDTATINIALFIAPGQVLTLKGGTLSNPLIEDDGTIQTQSNNPSTILGSITGTGVI